MLASEIARCKNVGGGPDDEDQTPPPCLTAQQKAKAEKTTKKKLKRDDGEVERAVVVAAAAERAEIGGSGSGIHIGDQLSSAQRAVVERIEASLGSPPRTIMLEGRRVSLEESQTQGVTKQQTQLAEQIDDAQQGEQVEEVE